ncbi:MAG: response regulator [Planctomycetota bacterium]|jgi:DNA-binding response OmpR family regulator
MENVNIIVVDDDPDFRCAIQAALESEGYPVITAEDRTQGMEKIRNEKPDLAVLYNS